MALFAVWAVNQLFPQGLRVGDPYMMTLVKTAGVMTLLLIVVKPLINLLLLPINLLSFGAVRWVAPVVVLWLTSVAVPGFEIEAFTTFEMTLWGVSIPMLSFPRWSAFLALSYVYSVVVYAIYWLFDLV